MSKYISSRPKTEEDALLLREYEQFTTDVIGWLNTDFTDIRKDIEDFLFEWDMLIENFEEEGFDTSGLRKNYEKVESKIRELNNIYIDIGRAVSSRS